MFQDTKKPCGKSLTSGVWSCRTKVKLKPNLTARPWSRDFLTFAIRGKWRKTSILSSPLSGFELTPRKNTLNTFTSPQLKETNVYNFKYKYIKAKRIYLKVTPCILVLKLAKKTSAKKSQGVHSTVYYS